MSTDNYTDWFCNEHGTVKQPITSEILECDECVEDSFVESSNADIEKPPFEGGIPLY